jgi:hypothetical protein
VSSQNSFPNDVTRISGLWIANSTRSLQDTKQKWKSLYVDIQFQGISLFVINSTSSGFEEYQAACLLVGPLERASPKGCGFVTITREYGNYNTVNLMKPNGRYIYHLSGFGGLEVACWPLVPKFAG